VGARCAHHWPSWHHFAPFWKENGTFPNLIQFRHFPELSLLLHDYLMVRSRFLGGGKVCSVGDPGDPVVTGCGCQYRKCDISATSACFQAGTSLEFAGEKEVSNKTEAMPIRGAGGKRLAKTFPDICLF